MTGSRTQAGSSRLDKSRVRQQSFFEQTDWSFEPSKEIQAVFPFPEYTGQVRTVALTERGHAHNVTNGRYHAHFLKVRNNKSSCSKQIRFTHFSPTTPRWFLQKATPPRFPDATHLYRESGFQNHMSLAFFTKLHILAERGPIVLEIVSDESLSPCLPDSLSIVTRKRIIGGRSRLPAFVRRCSG